MPAARTRNWCVCVCVCHGFKTAPLNGGPTDRAIVGDNWRNHGWRATPGFSHYRAMLCIRGTSHGPVSVSVTSRNSTKTAKRWITQTTPHDSPGTLVFGAKDLGEIRPESPPTKAPNAGGVGQNRRLSTNNRLYLENGTR